MASTNADPDEHTLAYIASLEVKLANAWMDRNECLAQVASLKRENERLRQWVPHPTEMSGFDDPAAEGSYLLETIAEACEIHGVPMPPHIADARGAGDRPMASDHKCTEDCIAELEDVVYVAESRANELAAKLHHERQQVASLSSRLSEVERERDAALRDARAQHHLAEGWRAISEANDASIKAVLGIIGNVDHSTGNGPNAAKMRGETLNFIRSMLGGREAAENRGAENEAPGLQSGERTT